jgi:Tol biopolymer transport system component/tRNA A-37 threonylcarbamoyl transferase component Bud32
VASTALDRLISLLADRYAVERELGAGGMATVYLARDQKHDRHVAIKVLHPDLAAALGGERFLSEIKTTARLQHPHILPLLDSGEADGFLFYVMPFVDGESLRDRLTRETQLPLDDALRITREVADALGYAHSHGVIHRDIKPENILLQGGHALVADFGIALAVQSAGGQRMTQTGLSLGTPQYMSPEQAMGERTIDARTDIYALGAVTYEMLAGDPPFTGSSVQAIVAKVMTERPQPLSTVRDTVTPAMERAVLRALAKLPADRFASAAEFAAALDSKAAIPESISTRRTSSWRARSRDPWVAGLVVMVAVLGAVSLYARRQPVAGDAFPVRVEIVAPVPALGSAALSPDGHVIAYVGRSPETSVDALYQRRLDQLASHMIPGTEGASASVFSPDGKWIAFVQRRRKVMKVSLDGGAPIPLADIADNGGVDWSTSGDVVVGAGVMEGGNGLFRVNPAGGPLVPLTHVDSARKELSHQWPRVLADGKTLLLAIWYGAIDRSEIAVTSLDDGKVVPLGILGAKPLGVAGGQLVYVRADGMAMAVPFDVAKRRVSGAPQPVQDSIRMWEGSGGDAYAFLTHEGGLVFARGTLNRRLVWVDHNGKAQPALPELREYRNMRLSPDGRRVALTIAGAARSDVWILDLASGTVTPLTTAGTVRNPTWSPDGRRILYVSTQGGRSGFWWQPADGSGPPVRAAVARNNPWNIDISPDGRTAVFNALYDGTFNLRSIALDSTHEERELAASPTAIETYGRFSPDGRHVAYQSDESGQFEVYVRSYPESGSRVQISNGGGRRPVWSPDGKTIYYGQGSRLASATLGFDPAPRVAARNILFEGRYEVDFDISRDGSRFLMIESESSGLGLVAVPNWLTELKRATH